MSRERAAGKGKPVVSWEPEMTFGGPRHRFAFPAPRFCIHQFSPLGGVTKVPAREGLRRIQSEKSCTLVVAMTLVTKPGL